MDCNWRRFDLGRRVAWASLFAVLLGGLLTIVSVTMTSAQASSDGWSSPVPLYTGPLRRVDRPVVVTDDEGRVHVFWELSELSEGNPEAGPQRPKQIYYTVWNGRNWSVPTDIVAFPQGELISATADHASKLHLLWHSGLTLYYSQAGVSKAGSARGWSPPAAFGPAYPHGQIAVDGRDWLHRVYAGVGTRGPYHQLSKDGGTTWSPPVNVARTTGAEAAADWVRVAVNEKGVIHVVWTEFRLPDGWPPTGVYYSRSEDGGKTWSKAVQLAGEGYDQINVVSAGNAVHVAWNGMAGVTGRFHRWSSDGGKSWSEPSMVTLDSGTSGLPQLAIDGAGDLHFLTVGDNRLWYSSWRGQKWSEPTYVPSGDEAGIPPVGDSLDFRVRHIESPAMAMGKDGRLHAVFWDLRRDRGITYIWYTSRLVSAPSVSPVRQPTSIPEPTATPDFVTTGRLFGRSGPGAGLFSADPEIPRTTATPPDPSMVRWAPNPRASAFDGIWWSILAVGCAALFTATYSGKQ